MDTPLLDLSFEYLKNGPTVGRTGQLTKIINNKDLTKSKYYDYDALGRLKTAYSFTNPNNPMTTNQWTQGYTYDRFGNRTGVTKTGTITYTDGLASLSFTDGAGKVRTNRVTTAGYTYDEAGNLTRGQAEGASPGSSVWQRYQYDAAGRLACTKDDSSVLIADYTYGASNHRLKQTEYGSGGTTCYYAWDGNSIIAEFSDTGSALSWTKSYVFLGGRLLATDTPGGKNYHHPDRLGTRLVTSETNGIVAAEQPTLPYGTALDVESMGTPTNRRFTSYDRSQKTKLDYAVNRFYNACQGRFTQVDPIGMSAASLEDPQSLNLYAYVGNDPINRIDPEGLGWLGKIFRLLAKIATAALVAVVLLTLPGWGVSLLLLGIAGLTGLAGWHNGTLGNISRRVLSFGFSGFNEPNFRTPSINGSSGGGVSGFLATQGQRPPAKRVIDKQAEALIIAALKKINPQSIKEDKEYAGTVCQNSDGTYSVLGPKSGTDRESNSPPCLKGTKLIALFHTHGRQRMGEDAGGGRRFGDSNLYSDSDKIGSNLNGVPKYLGTPSGAIKRFDPFLNGRTDPRMNNPANLLKGTVVVLPEKTPIR